MGHDSKRTALDDWESLLYLICWQATFGINNADRENVKADRIVAEVLKWRDGDMVDIANEKRRQMESLRNFQSTILAGFQDQYVLLKIVAVALYKALFQHKGCEGALLPTEKVDDLFGLEIGKEADEIPGDQPSVEISDPIVARKSCEAQIIPHLLAALRKALAVSETFLEDPATKQRIK
ncbi:hypothetical protein EV175_007348 [Coemansia sp. RSA 1933]|nr:hypothetical protein EV175_007348 [Coemansia sp. RSA 1933]